MKAAAVEIQWGSAHFCLTHRHPNLVEGLAGRPGTVLDLNIEHCSLFLFEFPPKHVRYAFIATVFGPGQTFSETAVRAQSWVWAVPPSKPRGINRLWYSAYSTAVHDVRRGINNKPNNRDSSLRNTRVCDLVHQNQNHRPSFSEQPMDG